MGTVRFPLPCGWGCAFLAALALSGPWTDSAVAQQPVKGEAAEPEPQVFALKHVSAHDAVRLLREVFAGPAGGKASVRLVPDPRTNSVFVVGDDAEVGRVARVLQAIDVPDEAEPPGEFQARLFWLVGVPPREEVEKLPDDLKDVAAELTRFGVEKLRLAAQAAVPVTAGSPFELSGMVPFEVPLRLTLSGLATAKGDGVALEVGVSVTQAPQGRDPRPAGGLRTNLTVPLGRPVLLGVTPTDGHTSAFVLLVRRRHPDDPSQPKPPPMEKRMTFEFRAAPWAKVLEWLSEATGLTLLSTALPPGTFTFIPPKDSKGYTIPEVIDVLNEALMAKGYLIVRRAQTITLAALDESIDVVPTIALEELGRYGKTELVKVVIPLKVLSSEEIAPEVKKILGPFGSVTALKGQLVVQDAADNVRTVLKLLKEIDGKGKK
jgi:hypothetical protein